MIENEAAAELVHLILTELEIPYAIIGGMAVQFWGEARYTKDLDLTIIIPIEDQDRFVQILESYLPSRREDALEFAQKNRIYLAQTRDGFPVDISLGLPGYEEEMVANAVDYVTTSGKTVRMCAAEDLIIQKAIAGRPQDIRDIQGIIIRQASSLDLQYIRYWLSVFAGWLETDGVIDRFEQAWRKYGPDA